jgi:hypothetical protein
VPSFAILIWRLPMNTTGAGSRKFKRLAWAHADEAAAIRAKAVQRRSYSSRQDGLPLTTRSRRADHSTHENRHRLHAMLMIQFGREKGWKATPLSRLKDAETQRSMRLFALTDALFRGIKKQRGKEASVPRSLQGEVINPLQIPLYFFPVHSCKHAMPES